MFVWGQMRTITIDSAIAIACEMPESLELLVDSALEAMDALRANFPKFGHWLAKAAREGLQFCFTVGNQDIAEDELCCPIVPAVQRLRLMLVPSGAGGGFGKILLGAALIGLGVSGIGIGILGISASSLGMLGLSLVVSGISGLFSRQNKPENDENEGKRSQIFRSPSQTFTEGGRVAVGYGVHLVGLTVISFKIETAYTPA